MSQEQVMNGREGTLKLPQVGGKQAGTCLPFSEMLDGGRTGLVRLNVGKHSDGAPP